MNRTPRRVHDEPAQPWRQVMGRVPVRVGRAKIYALSCGHRFTMRGSLQKWTRCMRCPAEDKVPVASPAFGLKSKRSAPQSDAVASP